MQSNIVTTYMLVARDGNHFDSVSPSFGLTLKEMQAFYEGGGWPHGHHQENLKAFRVWQRQWAEGSRI